MALQLIGEKTIERVHALAQMAGESVDDAVMAEREAYVQRVLKAAKAISGQLKFDSRTADEIVGYDEDGLPSS